MNVTLKLENSHSVMILKFLQWGSLNFRDDWERVYFIQQRLLIEPYNKDDDPCKIFDAKESLDIFIGSDVWKIEFT